MDLKKDKKYYGEVWFVNQEQHKQFCVMSFIDDDLVLETNLHTPKKAYKESQILGAFTGLGHLTFIDCRIKYSSSGITQTRIYRPKYSFVSDSHIVDAINLKFKEFFVVNEAIVKWVNFSPWYDTIDEKLIKKEFNDSYTITNENLQIKIAHYLKYHTVKRTELNISNQGSIKFELEEAVTVLSAIELYDQFQKVLQLVFGQSSKFSKFSFKCMGCGYWKQLYYNDKKLSKSTTTFVHTDYEKVKTQLSKILNATYSNKDFQFCLDKLMENFIGNQPSHNKRFTNSIATFEAYCKLFTDDLKTNLKKQILGHEDIFKKIGKICDEEWEKFPSKVVRSRDFHIHSNTGNRDVFSEFDLLYISFLFDFVIAYLLLSQIKVSKDLLDKYILHGNSVFVDMKRTNEILGSNPLL
ncbi:ApeA N-terminal domain 1-containing protein [Tenacibaculum crassostreae]|uniref:ApeA N-terminal domain 1-containing protein n=1 Tax=Tenacibaculum crassostreae TaxID=502683 RepID=UPI003894A7FF